MYQQRTENWKKSRESLIPTFFVSEKNNEHSRVKIICPLTNTQLFLLIQNIYIFMGYTWYLLYA